MGRLRRRRRRDRNNNRRRPRRDQRDTALGGRTAPEDDDAIVRLFGQYIPAVDPKATAEPQLLTKWASHVKTAVDAIERARQSLVNAVADLEASSTPLRQQWDKARKQREAALRSQLQKASVESPIALTRRVAELRQTVSNLKTVQKPKLDRLQTEIRRREQEHRGLLKKLAEFDRQLTDERIRKAKELTDGLGDQIRVTLMPVQRRDEYDRVLEGSLRPYKDGD